jgi:protein involved in polysaccharide export with SLBB domain
MNFLSKLSLSVGIATLAGMIFAGCASSNDEPLFSDNPQPSGMTGSPAAASPPATSASSAEAQAARLRVGETVIVDMTTGSADNPNLIPTQKYLVNDDGTITLPLIGAVQAAGKTPGELQDEIQGLYVPKYYVRLTVTVTTQDRVYYVGGEVMHPGAQVYLGETTVTKAIQAAGDFTNFASHTVYLTRANGQRIKVKVDKALRDATKDPPVFPGDQIQVPRRVF